MRLHGGDVNDVNVHVNAHDDDRGRVSDHDDDLHVDHYGVFST